MVRLPPKPTRTDTLFTDTTLFRSPFRERAVLRQDAGISILSLSLRRENWAAARPPGTDGGQSPQPAKGGHAERCVADARSVEHTSELQSLMRISYAVFCLNKKKTI